MERKGIDSPARDLTRGVAVVVAALTGALALVAGALGGASEALGVLTGSATREQFAAWPHTHLLASVAEVPALVLGAGVTSAAAPAGRPS